jgi:hypothetical protein
LGWFDSIQAIISYSLSNYHKHKEGNMTTNDPEFEKLLEEEEKIERAMLVPSDFTRPRCPNCGYGSCPGADLNRCEMVENVVADEMAAAAIHAELDEARRMLEQFKEEGFVPCEVNACSAAICQRYWTAWKLVNPEGDTDIERNRAACFNRYESAIDSFSNLDSTRDGQMENAKGWLQEKLVDQIDGEYGTFTYNENAFYSVVDTIEEIETWETKDDIPEPFLDLDFAAEFLLHVRRWVASYGCDQLRARVRNNIHSGYFDLESILEHHTGGTSDNDMIDWREFVKEVWDSLQYVKNRSYSGFSYHDMISNLEEEAEARDFSPWYANQRDCPFCASGHLMVHVDTTIGTPIAPEYRLLDWKQLDFGVKCSNSYCGFHWSDPAECQPFKMTGLLWMSDETKTHLTLDDLMKDEYFLTWVH